ncbi:MAG: MarR family winged helix-turn-helix transcriptional regulator [Flavobacteriaceae bacterium]
MKQETLDGILRATWQTVSKMYNKEAQKFNSTMATGFALLSIAPEGTPSTALGPKMGMAATSLSRLLKTMEARNLIYRVPNPEDGRSVLLCLTPFGVQKREDSKAVVLKFNETLRQKIEPSKIKTFLEVSQHIIDTAQVFSYY